MEVRILSNLQRAGYVQVLKVHVPSKPAVLPAEPWDSLNVVWGSSPVGKMLDALCRTLSSTQNVSTLIIEADGFFVETSKALSRWAWSRQPQLGNVMVPDNNTNEDRTCNRLGRLKYLETNLYAADGLGGFLAAHHDIESLKLHLRRDRISNDPGSLTYPFPSNTNGSSPDNSVPISSQAADAGAAADHDSLANMDNININDAHVDAESHFTAVSSPQSGVVLRPLLPNLRRIIAFPRGLAELTRGRPIYNIDTPLRELEHVEELVHAMSVCGTPVTHLKVVVFTVEILRTLFERLSTMRHFPIISPGIPIVSNKTVLSAEPAYFAGSLKMPGISTPPHRRVCKFEKPGPLKFESTSCISVGGSAKSELFCVA